MLYVYFIQAGVDGPVKIGLAGCPEERLIDMQTGNHVDLFLIAAIPGDSMKERRLHERFAAGRIRGEWFAYDTPGLQHFLAEAVETDLDFQAGVKLCAHCGFEVVRPPRTKVCSEDCYQARKRVLSHAWKRAQ